MRKIGVSPWADVRSSAEQIGGAYVFARKPNPANVARFSKEAVEKETVETIEACRENKCPYEFVLKDISTVNNCPQNIIGWTKTVMETIDRYYG
jgi:CRISPR/Cas system CSM-associated protein Csm5 (group 7 of RAMP superfamily)